MRTQTLTTFQNSLRSEPIDGEIIQPMDAAEARSCIRRICQSLEDARCLIVELYEREGWRSLGYSSFRECAIAEFRQSQAGVYRTLRAAFVQRQISQIENRPVPESQLRPLTQLPPEEQKEAWQEVQQRAAEANQPITAASVQAVVQERVQRTIKDLLPVGSIILVAYSREPNVVVDHYGDEYSSTLRVHPYWLWKETKPKLASAGWMNNCRILEGKVYSARDELLPISAEDAEWLYTESRKSGRYYSPDQSVAYNELVSRIGRPQWAVEVEKPIPPAPPQTKVWKPTCIECHKEIDEGAVFVGNKPFHESCKEVHYDRRTREAQLAHRQEPPVIDVLPEPKPSEIAAKPSEPDPAQERLDSYLQEAHQCFILAFNVDGEGNADFAKQFIPAEQVPFVEYWSATLHNLVRRVRELEAGLPSSQSVPITPGLRLKSRKLNDWTYTVKGPAPGGGWTVIRDETKTPYTVTTEELWGRFELYEESEQLPNPFMEGKAQWIDANSRLERVANFSLPQLHAALQVEGLQKTVRDAVERRIRKLEQER